MRGARLASNGADSCEQRPALLSLPVAAFNSVISEGCEQCQRYLAPIIESFWLQETLRVIQSNHNATLALTSVPKSF